MDTIVTAAGEQMRILRMRLGILKPAACHNCGSPATKRVQFFERYGFVTRYYECDSPRCSQARERAHV